MKHTADRRGVYSDTASIYRLLIPALRGTSSEGGNQATRIRVTNTHD